MRVVVTGGSGLAGRAVVAHLVQRGMDVTNVDLVSSDGPTPFRRVDLGDLGQVYGCLRGADAVVHFGAIPRPTFDVPEVVFRTNVMGTFNVLEAASALGITRVVSASSVSVLGYPFHERPFAPDYVPIDEAHRLQPQDAYALSKLTGEELAAGFARRGRLSVVSLRFSWIHTPETFAAQVRPLWSDAAAGVSNLWSYVDARDVAEAVRLALTAEIDGHEACFMAAPDSFMPVPSRELVAEFYPTTVVKEGFGDHDSLLSSAKAERLLGFLAKHTWRSYGIETEGGGSI
ncbi:MAG: NAD(P)-dependent oxidoreductase [Chloroflexia bacterium]|nr:NAD(P)-dependent oxidoreductase [Chloroflexia bacterium]